MANLLPRARYLSVVSWSQVNLESACDAITSSCVTTSGAQTPSSLIWKMEIIIFHALWDCCDDELPWNLGEVASSSPPFETDLYGLGVLGVTRTARRSSSGPARALVSCETPEEPVCLKASLWDQEKISQSWSSLRVSNITMLPWCVVRRVC